MKRLILILLTVCPFFTWGQKLTLDELIKFQSADFVLVNDILASKGWDFSGSKNDQSGYSEVAWAFEKNESDEASGWLTLMTIGSKNNVVSYQMHDSKLYNAIKTQISAYKMKSIDSKIEDDQISAVYQGQNHTVTIEVKLSDNKPGTNYLISVMSNATYVLYKLGVHLDNIEKSGSDKHEGANANQEYKGEYIYKTKALSYAKVFRDIRATQMIYQVPPDHFVYVIAEVSQGVVRVFCNGNYGYMLTGMLKE